MAIEVLLIREGTKLVAAEPMSLEAIEGLKQGETVTATIRRPRNPAHHRQLWALLNVVFQNQNTFATTQELLSALKMATGLFDIGKTIDGLPFAEMKSISFVSMDQTRFEQWFDKAVEVILTKILPGLDRADLERQVHDILEGRRT